MYEGDKFQNVQGNIYILFRWLMTFSSWTKDIEFLNFAKSNAKGISFTHIQDTCLAYKTYLDAQLNK